MPRTDTAPATCDLNEAVRWYVNRAVDSGPGVSMYDIGVPVPIWPSRSPASEDAAARRVGMHVHKVIADIAPTLGADGVDAHAVIRDAVSRIVRGRDVGRMGRVQLTVSGLAHQYVRAFLPSAATFVASEIPAAGGRADLLWNHPDTGWFYDEIKTTTHPVNSDERLLVQLDRYRRAGLVQFGREFAGVRLVPLGNSTRAVLVRPDGEHEQLATSLLSPARLTPKEEASA